MQGSWIEIDRKRLVSNLGAFRSLLSPDCALMAVVKANAYGHGANVVAPVAAEHADWLGIHALEEAIALRELGVERPLAVLGPVDPAEARAVIAHDLRVVLFRLDLARALSQEAQRTGRRARIHLKIETGTNRLGVPLSELPQLLDAIQKDSGVEIEGVYTHFANIEDTLDPSFSQLQLRRFREALALLERAGVKPRFIHSAASAAVLVYPETHFSLVRVGIGAYGIWPSRETRIAARQRDREITLQPILTWKSRLAQVKAVTAGEHVGYGLSYRATRPMRLGIVPVGYSDGYDRKLSNNGRVVVRGQTAPVVGRVAMNMFMVDVTDTDAEQDDEVVLLGGEPGAEIPVEELAEKAGTIPYEILARLHPALPRRLV